MNVSAGYCRHNVATDGGVALPLVAATAILLA
jgi:hypothetical protein